MKAMILAAGRGERMKPLTDTTPKPLLKVAQKPLIEHHLDNLVKANFNKVVINHAWLGEQIEQHLGDGSRFNATIEYSPEPSALETAGGIVQALPLLAANPSDVFLVVNGDIFCTFDFSSLPPLAADKLAHLILVKNPEHNPKGDFALNDQHVLNEGEHQYTFSGIGLYRAELFDELSSGKRALAPLLRQAIAQNKVTGQYFDGLWTDVGTPQRLEQINKDLAKFKQREK